MKKITFKEAVLLLSLALFALTMLAGLLFLALDMRTIASILMCISVFMSMVPFVLMLTEE